MNLPPILYFRFMKNILFLLLVISPFFCVAQDIHEIKLSGSLNETRMGKWTMGDYSVYIEMSSLETSFRNTGNSYLKSVSGYPNDDSTAIFYKLTAQRYLEAADQLHNAGNGFDLKSLRVYYGPGNENENSIHSFIVQNYVRRLVKSGMSAVYYQGKRVYILKRLHKQEGEGLSYDYLSLIYFDDIENCLFKDYHHVGW